MNRNTISRIMIFLSMMVITLFLVQCHDGSDSGGNCFTCQFRPGTTWKYRAMFNMPNMDDHTVIDTVEYIVLLKADTVAVSPDSIVAIGIAEIDDLTGYIYGREFWANLDDGLHTVGSQGYGIQLMQDPGNARAIYMNRMEEAQTRDLSYIRWFENGESNLLLPYPAYMGESWIYQPSSSSLAGRHTIVGRESIDTALGKMWVVHKLVSLLLERGESINTDYYYSDEGVVHSFTDLGTDYITDEEGEIIMQYESWARYELIEYIPGE